MRAVVEKPGPAHPRARGVRGRSARRGGGARGATRVWRFVLLAGIFHPETAFSSPAAGLIAAASADAAGECSGLTCAAGAPPADHPADSPAVTLESGVLWEVGTSTPFPYRLWSTQLSWRSAPFLARTLADGSRLVVRHRLTLIGTLIQQGPESHYAALAGSPSLEWWDRTGAWSAFFGAGGGAGAIDSRGIDGGQGQDFTLNWFIRGGLEHVTARDLRWSAGLLYQHLSNGGMTRPNPGIDALGFSVGCSWRY